MSIHFDELRSEQQHDGASSRRRWFAVVGATMLVAVAAGAGYGIGRNVDGESTSVEPAEETATSPSTVAIGDDEASGVVDSTPPTILAPLAEAADGPDVPRRGAWAGRCSGTSRWSSCSTAPPTPA